MGKSKSERTGQSVAAGIRNLSCCAWQMKKVGDVPAAAAKDTIPTPLCIDLHLRPQRIDGDKKPLFLDIVNISAPATLVAEVHRTIPLRLASAGRTWNPVGERFGIVVVVHSGGDSESRFHLFSSDNIS